MFMFTLLSNRYGFILRLFGRNLVVSCGPKKGMNPNTVMPMKEVAVYLKNHKEFVGEYYPQWDFKAPPTKVIGCRNA